MSRCRPIVIILAAVMPRLCAGSPCPCAPPLSEILNACCLYEYQCVGIEVIVPKDIEPHISEESVHEIHCNACALRAPCDPPQTGSFSLSQTATHSVSNSSGGQISVAIPILNAIIPGKLSPINLTTQYQMNQTLTSSVATTWTVQCGCAANPCGHVKTELVKITKSISFSAPVIGDSQSRVFGCTGGSGCNTPLDCAACLPTGFTSLGAIYKCPAGTAYFQGSTVSYECRATSITCPNSCATCPTRTRGVLDGQDQ